MQDSDTDTATLPLWDRDVRRRWVDGYKAYVECERCGVKGQNLLTFLDADTGKRVAVGKLIANHASFERLVQTLLSARPLCKTCLTIETEGPGEVRELSTAQAASLLGADNGKDEWI
jgi:hypothetical protein